MPTPGRGRRHRYTVRPDSNYCRLIVGATGLGRFIACAPYSLVSGLSAGFGVFTIAIQLLPALGAPPTGGRSSAIALNLRAAAASVNPDAVAVAAVSFAVCLLWRGRLNGILAAPVVSLVAGAAAGMALFRDAPVFGAVAGWPELAIPFFAMGDAAAIVEAAIILALINSLDTLLTAVVIDSATGERPGPAGD